jgi:hypothetical protein
VVLPDQEETGGDEAGTVDFRYVVGCDPNYFHSLSELILFSSNDHLDDGNHVDESRKQGRTD